MSELTAGARQQVKPKATVVQVEAENNLLLRHGVAGTDTLLAGTASTYVAVSFSSFPDVPRSVVPNHSVMSLRYSLFLSLPCVSIYRAPGLVLYFRGANRVLAGL